jgi:tRNA-uridine 2-sulfurtransferase
VLHMLDQAQLARTLFPVGSMTKADVRTRAAALGLRTAAKPDSQDVCFITRRGREQFLGARIPLHRGKVVDAAGAQVGEVDALELVTVGQRKGLGVVGGGDPLYAVDVDRARGVVTVGGADDLLDTSLALDAITWTDGPARGPVLAQVSAHGAPRAAVVDGDVLTWDAPQRRVASGQSVVLYDLDDTTVLGGGMAR